MGLFRGHKDHSKEHSKEYSPSPQNGAASPRQSQRATSARLQKLGDLFSDVEGGGNSDFFQVVQEEVVNVSAPTIDMDDLDKKDCVKVRALTHVTINDNRKMFEDDGRRITFTQTAHGQRNSIGRSKSRHENILQRAGSISLMTTRDSIKRSVSRKIARSESRLHNLKLTTNDNRDAGTGSGGATPVTLSPRRNSQNDELTSSGAEVKLLSLSRTSSVIKKPVAVRNTNDDNQMDSSLGNGDFMRAYEDDDVFLVEEARSGFSLTSGAAEKPESFGTNVVREAHQSHSLADPPEAAPQLTTGQHNAEDLLPKRRKSKRPPPLLNSDCGIVSGDPASDWPITSVFGHDGGFITGGFKITVEGMVKRPTITTREDSDCELDGEIPQSDRNLMIIRSLTEVRPGVTIGSGAAGRVYLAEHIPSKRTVAMKVVSVFDKERRNQLLKELETLSTYVSRFLVRFYGAFYDGSGAVHIALEYMDHGCLSTFIQRVGPIPERVVQMITIDCVRGLRFLHANHVLHRDLKTANILLSRRLCCAKLSDFGLARALDAGVSRVGTFVGTVAYMSPERLEGSKYTYASDVWALGVSMMECLLGRYPFDRPQNYFDYIDATMTANMWSTCDQSELNISSQARDFITQCTIAEPKQRPLAKDLLEHPWLFGMKKNSEVFGSWLDHCRIKSMQAPVLSPNSAGRN